MPAPAAARSGAGRAFTRAGHVLSSIAMGLLLAVLALGLALDGSLRRLDEHDR
ncbi:hypothetical protein [Clavibacter sp. Sh2088]|uniref:hypothetical protein n=1 Tax=Clavibacter sp. Sh2088 TaxID=3397676 RepID=UPI0039E0AC2D